MRISRLAGRAAAALLVASALAACSEAAVLVEQPRPPATERAVCERLAAVLPAEVAGGERRDVEPEGPLVAAWNDPPIVLRCGVPQPPLDPDGEQPDVGVNGVTWAPVNAGSGYVFTTVGRTAYVEVAVPRAYAPEVNPLVDLAAAVSEAVPAG